MHNKLKELLQNQRFKPQERQFLIDQWHQIQDQTERATKELDAARAQFAGLLQTCCAQKENNGARSDKRLTMKTGLSFFDG